MYNAFKVFCQRHNASFTRGFVVVSGEVAGCESRALRLAATALSCMTERTASPSKDYTETLIWIGDDLPPPEIVAAVRGGTEIEFGKFKLRHVHRAKAKQLLGSDLGHVILNAHHGMDLNTLGVISGALRGGKLLFLLTPPLDQWGQFDDPEYQRYTTPLSLGEPETPSAMIGGFNTRFGRIIHNAINDPDTLNASCIFYDDDHKSRAAIVGNADCLGDDASSDVREPVHKNIDNNTQPAPTGEQRIAIEHIVQVARDAQGCVLFTADRGRGKTWALGFAAASVISEQDLTNTKSVLICAPHRKSVDTLFAVCRDLLASLADIKKIQFVAIDALLDLFQTADPQQTEKIALCIIDEAAGIPIGLLQRIADAFPRTIFSSTTFGYEGSGRGFLLRFAKKLRQTQPCFKQLQLQQPIRWHTSDQFEPFFSKLLLLGNGHDIDDKNAVRIDEAGKGSGEISYREVSQQNFQCSELLLTQVFRLLVDAHYQTSPNDLRYLLDTPYTRIWIAEELITDDEAVVIAVLLVSQEGGFVRDTQLLNDIAAGKRRPRGNMLAQLLTYSAREIAWCKHIGWRIMRIAVAQNHRRQGIGKQLVRQMEAAALSARCSYWGSVFAFDQDNSHFWRSCNTRPVHLGLHRDKSSGARNIAIVKLLDADQSSAQILGKNINEMSSALCANVPQWQTRFCTELSDQAIRQLTQWCEQSQLPPSDDGLRLQSFDQGSHDRKIIQRFVDGEIAIELAYMAIKRYWDELASSVGISKISTHDRKFVIKLLDCAPQWSVIANQFELAGRGGVMRQLREILHRQLAQ